MTTSINPTGHDHATGFPLFAPEAVLEVRTPAPETWTGAEWNAHVTAATSNRNGVPERLIACPTPVCTTTCPARLNESITIPAEPDTRTYRVEFPDLPDHRPIELDARNGLATQIHRYIDPAGSWDFEVVIAEDGRTAQVVNDDGTDSGYGTLTIIEVEPTAAQGGATLTAQTFRMQDAIAAMAVRYGDSRADYIVATLTAANYGERDRLIRAQHRRYRAIMRLTRQLADLSAQGGESR